VALPTERNTKPASPQYSEHPRDIGGSDWAIEWSARQAGGELHDLKIMPEMPQALETLRRQLDK
jgi:hypothetical protein